MNIKTAAFTFIAVTAGVFALTRAKNAPLSGLWVSIPGGEFVMGTDIGGNDTKPRRMVAIKAFEMSRTPVTVEQYAECVDKGVCSAPGTGGHCNWDKAGRQLHPVNCVDWNQATKYAGFRGARLPSEAEWEYAATGGGKDRKYPWGNEAATCERAVMSGCDGDGLGAGGTMAVCSKPAGNTGQGLCDMAGNVWQWVQDKYQNSYMGTPTDGSAFEGVGPHRVIRGGSFYDESPGYLRTDFRNIGNPGDRYAFIGFRLARQGR